jgi:CYTH domain-containing protein
MPVEIERKFLVIESEWLQCKKDIVSTHSLIQGYLHSDENKTIRIRVADEKAYLTIKGKSDAAGLSRAEYEYEIPLLEGKELLTMCGPLIVKKRYKISYEGALWDVDVFDANHKGLILAEIELESTTQLIALPSWVGQEVTGDVRYYNSTLSKG